MSVSLKIIHPPTTILGNFSAVDYRIGGAGQDETYLTILDIITVDLYVFD